MILVFLIIFFVGYNVIKVGVEIIKDITEPLINVKIPKESLTLKEVDTHGGFLGEGDYFTEIQLSDKGYLKFLNDANNSGKWASLPMTSELNAKIYGTHGKEYFPSEIKNGIYYFKDRYSKDNPDYKNGFLERSSFNYTVAIVDFDTKKLYIFEYDS